MAVRTPTLPPATHTNCYVAGRRTLSVFDPASPWEDQQALLWAALEGELAGGARVERIVLTHHHGDHVSGAAALKRQLAAVGLDVPILAHAVTAELLEGDLEVDGFVEAGQIMACDDVHLQLTHTPGHAPGHLVFQDASSRAMIAGDMVAGVGTIAIDPDDGHLGQYLASLALMAELGPSVLLPSHGPALPDAQAILAHYIAHRHMRSDQVLAQLASGTATAEELAPRVYPHVPTWVLLLAARQITSHLRWLGEHGLAVEDGGRWRRT